MIIPLGNLLWRIQISEDLQFLQNLKNIYSENHTKDHVVLLLTIHLLILKEVFTNNSVLKQFFDNLQNFKISCIWYDMVPSNFCHIATWDNRSIGRHSGLGVIEA